MKTVAPIDQSFYKRVQIFMQETLARKDTRVIHENFLLYMVNSSVRQIMITAMTETDHQLIKHEFLREKTGYVLSSECKTLL